MENYEKTGWDKIAEQELKNNKRSKRNDRLETAGEVTHYVTWIVIVAAAILIAIIAAYFSLWR